MNHRRIIIIAVAGAILMITLATGAQAGAARPARQASLTTGFTRVGDRCYPELVATWSGYQVNHIRFVGYREGRSGNDADWLDTRTFPKSASSASGSFTSTVTVAARPGEGWYGYAIFRSTGGARLAEAWSSVVYAPADCLYP